MISLSYCGVGTAARCPRPSARRRISSGLTSFFLSASEEFPCFTLTPPLAPVPASANHHPADLILSLSSLLSAALNEPQPLGVIVPHGSWAPRPGFKLSSQYASGITSKGK
uniref:Uncharacterized protein n=1 Tax=Knipowitschia caucasica TaxID=637954 RepID=A0AAV2L9W0_KNICA